MAGVVGAAVKWAVRTVAEDEGTAATGAFPEATAVCVFVR